MNKLTITLSKTRDGLADYLQIMSEDFMAVNIVLIAGSIEVVDARTGVVAQQKSRSQERRENVMANADAEDRSVRGRTKKR